MYDVVYQTYDFDGLYDIVRLTYDIVDHDIVRTPRTTSSYDIVRMVRTMSYDYDVVRLNIRCRTSISVLYDIVRLTYDVVRRQESRCPARAARV